MIEVLIVTALVLWSSLVVFKKVFPKTAYSVFLKLSHVCAAQGWTSLASWLKPKMVSGCGGNCACPGNQPKASVKAQPQTVKWK